MALILLPGACAQAPVPQDSFYRIQVEAPARAIDRPPLDGILEVDRLLAEGLLAGRAIVYSHGDRPNELGEYHYHFWTEPPAVMLQAQLVSHIRALGLARAAVTPEMRLEPDFVITGRLKRLEQVVGSVPRVAVGLEFSLRKTGTDRLLLIRDYDIEVPARDGSVAAAVDAINIAVAQLLGKLAEDLAAI